MRLNEEQINSMIENSFKNYHVKGFDYICIYRTPTITRKVYFFDGNVSQLPEVVNPHDHRYHFVTTVLTGVMSNSHYVEDEEYGDVYNKFSWNTPLNGGDGFKHLGEARLFETTRYHYIPGQSYTMLAQEFHTIRMHRQGTVIMLDQYSDVVDVGVPTLTFMKEKQSPDLNGLYERFTHDEMKMRCEQINELAAKINISIFKVPTWIPKFQ